MPAIQDHYPDDVAHCYGCGRLNPEGLQLKTTWDGDETVAYVTPRNGPPDARSARGEVVAVRIPETMTKKTAD
jgi:hypothetical protein